MATIQCDTLIIGAGLIGSSVAMHLAQKGQKEIRVIDFDLEGTLSSSELNAGGVRATWVHPVNILSSKDSIEYYQTVASEVGYRPCGYLWLIESKDFSAALDAQKTQTSLGWEVEALEPKDIPSRFPYVNKTEDLGGALFAPQDGLINPNRLKNHYREKAGNGGVVFDDRTWVRGASYGESGVQITAEFFLNKPLDLEEKKAVLTADKHSLKSRSVTYQAKRVINCAGPWASSLAKILGYALSSKPVRRQVCIFDCREFDLTPYGMTVDPSGVYFHPEATNGLAGFADPEEKEGFRFDYDDDQFFMEKIWPVLFERSSYFERLRHITGWAGLYEVSPDHGGIIGKVHQGEAGRSGRVFEAHSYSGHGAMHSYAAGRGLSELMVEGRYTTLDLKPLSGDRFEEGKPIREGWVI